MLDLPSEYPPADNAQDKRIIPMFDPVPTIDASYAIVLHDRAMSNYTACQDAARAAYGFDNSHMEDLAAQAEDYLTEALAYCDFIDEAVRVRSN